MTIIIEISRPIQWRPWRDHTRVAYRVGWLWFAVAWLRVPLDEFCDAPKVWQE